MKQAGQEKNKVAIAEKELFPVLSYVQSQIVLDDKLKEIANAFGQSSIEPVRKEFERFLQKNPWPLASLAATENAPRSPQGIQRGETHAKGERSPKEELEGIMLGILLSLENDPLQSKLKSEYETLTKKIYSPETIDSQTKARFISEMVNESSPEKAFHRAVTRYHLLQIDEEKAMLDRILITDPSSEETLAKIHEILKQKDHLIHELHNH
jgi:hypothetical protein